MRFLRLIFLSAAILSGLVPAMAQNSSTSGQKAKLEREIEILDKQLRSTSKKSENALSALTLTRKKVSSRKKLLQESDKRLAELDANINQKNRELRKLQARLDTMTVYYARLVRGAYRNRDSRKWFMYILSSGSITQAAHRYSYLRNLSKQMNERARKIEAMQAEVKSQRTEVQNLRSAAATVRAQRASDLGKLQKEEAASKQLVSKLNKDKTKYQKQLAMKRKQVEALNRQMAKMVSGSKPKAPVDIKLSEEFSSNKGKLPWPAEGPVVDSFGEHYHPVYKKVKLPFNNGINIAVAQGTEAKSVFNGTVKQVIVMPGYNKCVLVQHGGYFTFYCKLASVSVKAGDKIKTGQSLGRVDTISGETQLHFEIWEGTSPKDPESWLR